MARLQFPAQLSNHQFEHEAWISGLRLATTFQHDSASEHWSKESKGRSRPRSSSRDLGTQLDFLARALGFDFFAYLALRGSGENLTDCLLHDYESNLPDSWKEKYRAAKLHEQDPIVAIGRMKRGIFAWSSKDPALCLTEAHRRIADAMCMYKIHCGISAPVFGPRGEFSLLTLASDNSGRDLTETAIVLGPSIQSFALSNHALAFSETCKDVEPSDRSLTTRQKECLFWTALGKTSWEISRIIGRTEATVNYHLQNAMSKLDATNKCHAVTKAITRGLFND